MEPDCPHPYAHRPATAFWKSAVAEVPPDAFDPLVEVPFAIAPSDRVATAGSCFAQHLSKALIAEGVNFLMTEAAPEAQAAGLPVFSARYGNVYTTRQLRQLFDRAYGLSAPDDFAWQRPDGRFVDAFRPNEFPDGFASPAEMRDARRLHLAAVRAVFERCDVFVLTLGLTEVWLSDEGGFAVPLPPGVVAAPRDPAARFSPKNLTVAEMTADLTSVLDDIRLVNPGLRVVLSVSPVPITATFHAHHVVVSNTYSKAALRVVAGQVAEAGPDILYFPSYELAVGHPSLRFFDASQRRIGAEGVGRVMALFRRLLGAQAPARPALPAPVTSPPPVLPRLSAEFEDVVCDEDLLAG